MERLTKSSSWLMLPSRQPRSWALPVSSPMVRRVRLPEMCIRDRSIFFLGEAQGAQPLYKLDIARKTISPVVTGKAISEFDFDNKGMVYYTYSTTGKPSALYRQQMKKWNGTPVARGKEQQITFLNQKLEDEVDIRPSESIWVDGACLLYTSRCV